MPYEPLERDEQVRWLEQARTGDGPGRTAALDRLLADFRPAALSVVYRTLASLGLGSEHAEEAVQQAILRFLQSGLSQYRGGASPRTYFTRIALRCALDQGRRPATLVPLTEDGSGPVGAVTTQGAGGAEDQLEAYEIRRFLEICLERLPAPLLAAVRLYYLEEAGACRDCAKALGLGEEAFMKRLSRARQRLAECLKKEATL